MEKKEILRIASEELRFLTKDKEFYFSGRVFEFLVKKYDSSVPKNKDPALRTLEQVIISLMEKNRLYTPDIILMNYQNEDKNIVSVEEIGEIKLGFGEIKKTSTQQIHFLPDLKKFLENFDERIKERGVVFTRPWKIKLAQNCSLFYVLPQGIDLPEEISSTKVFHSFFSYKDIRQIARDYLARSQSLC